MVEPRPGSSVEKVTGTLSRTGFSLAETTARRGHQQGEGHGQDQKFGCFTHAYLPSYIAFRSLARPSRAPKGATNQGVGRVYMQRNAFLGRLGFGLGPEGLPGFGRAGQAAFRNHQGNW